MTPSISCSPWVESFRIGLNCGIPSWCRAGEPPTLDLGSGFHPDAPCWFPPLGSTLVSLRLRCSPLQGRLTSWPDSALTAESLSGLPQQLGCESSTSGCTLCSKNSLLRVCPAGLARGRDNILLPVSPQCPSLRLTLSISDCSKKSI